MMIENRPFFSSWSGGKDSALALYYALRQGGQAKVLLTMFTEKGDRSRSHGLSLKLLTEQAKSLNIPLMTQKASWDNYEAQFVSALKKLSPEVKTGVFGDIDIQEHRLWVERVCSSADIQAYHPLWKKNRRDLLNELIEVGFKAMIITVKEGILEKEFLGKIIDFPLIERLEKLGIDACGEAGEFHTIVFDGPIFSSPLQLELYGQVFKSGYWFQDLGVKTC